MIKDRLKIPASLNIRNIAALCLVLGCIGIVVFTGAQMFDVTFDPFLATNDNEFSIGFDLDIVTTN